MTDLIKGLLSQMSSKFNEQTNSELVKNLDYQEDKTLKWKTLINNTYAKKDREKRNKNRNKDGEDSADDKTLIQQLPSSPTSSLSENQPSTSADSVSEIKGDGMEMPESSEIDLLIDEKFGNDVKEKKIVIDDDLHTPEQKTAAAQATSTHTSANKESDDDEKKFSTNLPQLKLNTNSQAIETTKATSSVTTSTATDKKCDDNTVMSSKQDSIGVALSDDDKRAGSSTKTKISSNSTLSKFIDKTSSLRNLRSNKNSATNITQSSSSTQTQKQSNIIMSDDKNKSDEATIKNDVEENEGNNEDSSATTDTTQSFTPKKGRGRPKLENKNTNDVKLKAPADGGGGEQQSNENENEVTQKRGRGRLPKARSILEPTDEKKAESAIEDLEIKKEMESEETPKRRGRSRKIVEEKEDKESETQNDEDGSKSQDQTESPKRKRGRFNKNKNIETDSTEDNKNETTKTVESADDSAKPRLLMTIRTDKSAVPKIITQSSTATTVADDQEKIIKKRGRRPKATSITKPIQVKKSLRLAKDESDANISETLNIRKEKPEPLILAPPVGRIRSQRRIKPTAKILANEELRQGFEVTNCKRLSLSNENLMDHYDRSPPSGRSGNETSSTKSPAVSSPESKIIHEPPLETALQASCVTSHHHTTTPKKPCRDPQEFLNEIKTFKIGFNRSPEDNKKLTKSQHRRLIKAKEKHLGLLGLRPKINQSTTSNDSSDNEDFVPSKFNRSHRTAATLRLRNQRAAEMTRRNLNLRKREHAVAINLERRLNLTDNKTSQQEIEMSDDEDDDCIVVENSKSSHNGNKENNNINLICSCHQKTKYFIKHGQNLSFSDNGKLFCCAIDEIESRKIGCTNELSESLINLFRPSVKVSYMVLCNSHRKRLVSHNCCSGCGIFCTQGTFVICSNKHFFHRNCAIKYILNTPYDPNNPNYTGPTLLLKCPHCNIDAPDYSYRVTMRCENLPVFVQHRSNVP